MSSSSAGSLAAKGAADAALPRSGYLHLVALSVFWGLNWPVMKFSMTEIPVWNYRTVCLLGGALGLAGLAIASGQRVRLRAGELGPLLLCTLFNMVGWHMLAGYAISQMEAGRGAIVAFTMPLWAALMGAFLLREPLRPRVVVGLLLGLGGIAVLLSDDLSAMSRSPLGTLLMLSAAFCWGLGTVLTKRFAPAMPVLSFAAWQCALALPVLVPGMLLLEGLADYGSISLEVWGALAYSIGICMLFCYWAWYSVVRLFPAVIASIGTLAIPVVGLLSSAALLGEPLGWTQVIALLLVSAGLVVVLVLPALRRAPQPPAPPEAPLPPQAADEREAASR